MLLIIAAYLGGVLTILSPCILPVLPFVFARSDQPFLKSGLPLLLGMAATFAVVASLAAVGGGWAVQANQYGRWIAIVLMALFGLALLFPSIADHATRPLVAWGERLSSRDAGASSRGAFVTSLLLGVATGLLWSPCAGPILGLVLTGAALGGASAKTSLLLLAYAAGAATSLAAALLIGGRVFAFMKRSLGAGEWIRRGIGIALLAGVVAIAFGLDTGVLSRLSTASTASFEQAVLDKVRPMPTDAAPSVETLAVEPLKPTLAGAVQWLNSEPLSIEALRGKVVLVDFWTYSCINCLRSLPYVRAWAEKYKDRGLVVVGVHAPEFAFEKDVANVRKAIADLGVTYPVAVDNDYAIWRAFGNRYWPAHYFIDAQGRVRHHHFGEGEYDESERVIRALLAEAGHGGMPGDLVSVDAKGAQAGYSADNKSPETYVGYERAERFVSIDGFARDAAREYQAPATIALNEWALSGNWLVTAENATLVQAGGRIAYRFHARDLHLVLGPAKPGATIAFRVTIDGHAPGADHGVDVDADGHGVVKEQRLYQLVRQQGAIDDRLFEIEFVDPGVQAFAFTFG